MRTNVRSDPAPAYLWAALQIQSGYLGPSAYDERFVSDSIARMTGGRVRDILSPTPPSLAVLVLPFTWVPSRQVAGVWAGINVVAIAVTLGLMVLLVGTPGYRLPLLCVGFGGLLMSAPMQENLRRGQIYVWLMGLVSFAIWGARAERSISVGAALAAAMLFKLLAWPAWLALAVQHRWKTLVWAGGLTGLVVAASLPWIGPDTWFVYITRVIPQWMSDPRASIPAYQTLAGWWRHLFTFHASWNTKPFANAPAFAFAGTVVSNAGVLLATLLSARRSEAQYAMAAAVVAGVIMSPVAEQYHYLVLAPALVLATTRGMSETLVFQVAALLCSAALMYAPLPFKNPDFWGGAWAFLAYPRLYGGLILWAILLRQARIPATSPSARFAPPHRPAPALP